MLAAATIAALIKPYVRRELPGWARLYRLAVGNGDRDWFWSDQGERWVTGKMHGYEMRLSLANWSNRKTYFLERFYDLNTQLLLQAVLQPGDTFIDIGANEGMMSLLASRLVGESGKVIAFEPNPKALSIMNANIQRNGIGNIEVRPFGLSSSPGFLRLSVPRAHTGRGTFASLDPTEDVETVECGVRVADRELSELQPRCVKIDVEGFEENTLRGMSETISRVRPIIVVEMLEALLRRAGSSKEKLISLFQDLNYVGRRLGSDRTGLSRFKLKLVDPSSEWRDGDYLWVPSERVTSLLLPASNATRSGSLSFGVCNGSNATPR